MAILINENELYKAKKNAYGLFFVTKLKYLNLFFVSFFLFRVKLINIYKRIFQFFNRFFCNFFNKEKSLDLNVNSIDLSSYEKSLKENDWVFIENFLDEDSYNTIVENWPTNNYFYLSNNPLKYYYSAFRIINDKSEINFNYKEIKNQAIRLLYKYLSSDKFLINCKKIFGEGSWFHYSCVASVVGHRSYLVPHVDTISKDKLNTTYNFIYFIDGNEDCYLSTGATGIYLDNCFEKPIFIPSKLRNTCLLYNSSSNFFHGFNFCSKNAYRKVITFQFLNKDSL
jgi:hypothetical protein